VEVVVDESLHPVPLRFTGVEVGDGRAVIRGVPSP